MNTSVPTFVISAYWNYSCYYHSTVNSIFSRCRGRQSYRHWICQQDKRQQGYNCGGPPLSYRLMGGRVTWAIVCGKPVFLYRKNSNNWTQSRDVRNCVKSPSAFAHLMLFPPFLHKSPRHQPSLKTENNETRWKWKFNGSTLMPLRYTYALVKARAEYWNVFTPLVSPYSFLSLALHLSSCTQLSSSLSFPSSYAINHVLHLRLSGFTPLRKILTVCYYIHSPYVQQDHPMPPLPTKWQQATDTTSLVSSWQ